MLRRRTRAALLTCALVLCCGRARAQTPPSQPTSQPELSEGIRKRAAALFRNGSALFNAHSFKPARAEFQKAYDLTKAWQVLFYIGICLSREHKHLKAIATLEKYLAAGGKRIAAQKRVQAQFELKLLRGQLARAVISVNVAGAEVRVDGRLVGRSPLGKPVVLGPDEYEISASKPGYQTQARKLELKPSQSMKLAFTLEKKRTLLSVASVPAGASARIDGKSAGTTPLKTHLPVGDHDLELRLDGYKPYQRRLTLEPDAPLPLLLQLDKLPPTPWYKRWWLWTAVGAVVVGAVVTAVALSLAACPQDLCTGNLPLGGAK